MAIYHCTGTKVRLSLNAENTLYLVSDIHKLRLEPEPSSFVRNRIGLT